MVKDVNVNNYGKVKKSEWNILSKFRMWKMADSEANINIVGDRRMPILIEFNETAISTEEIWEAVN